MGVNLIKGKAEIFEKVLRKTIGNTMMLGSKGLLPPTDAHELLRSKLLPQFCKHSESVDLLRKSLLPHVWRVPSSKALSCKHERLFDLLTLASYYRKEERIKYEKKEGHNGGDGRKEEYRE